MKKITILFHTQTKQHMHNTFKKRFALGRTAAIKKTSASGQADRWGNDYLIPNGNILSFKEDTKEYILFFKEDTEEYILFSKNTY